MEYTVHEQVRKQLEYLKLWVDDEEKNEKQCKEWGIPYTPSRTKWQNIRNYERYKEEIEKNGDKNLLIMVKMNGENRINMYGIYPFAKRYVDENYLVHRNEHGGEILFKKDEVKVIKM